MMIESRNTPLNYHLLFFGSVEKITIEDQEIERVEEYKYLRQTLRLKDSSKEEIMRRISWMELLWKT